MTPKKIPPTLLRLRKPLQWLGGATIVVLIGLAVWILHQAENAGISPFQFDSSVDINKETPNGVPYTINYSEATFSLDVTHRDRHTKKTFPDYRSALEYCGSQNLKTIPSVQSVHGKCKQFDDYLCATLELAMQRGLPEIHFPGVRPALQRLLAILLSERTKSGLASELRVRNDLDKAVIHIATALELGGAEVVAELDPNLAVAVRARRDEFLAQPLRSRPIGFWKASDESQNAFAQDRYLMSGFRVSEDAGVCAVLAASISRDQELADSFERLRSLHAALTNPGRFVSQSEFPARAAPLVSVEDLATKIPPDVSITDLLRPGRLDEFRTSFTHSFSPGSGFALVSYAASKEYDLLFRMADSGRLSETSQALLRYSRDPGLQTRLAAIHALGESVAPKAIDRIAELLAGPDELDSSAALEALQTARWKKRDFENSWLAERMDPILCTAVRNLAFSGDHRCALAGEIGGAEARRIACESLILHPTGEHYREVQRCLVEGAEGLADLPSGGVTTLPALRKSLSNPGIDSWTCSRILRAIQKIETRKE